MRLSRLLLFVCLVASVAVSAQVRPRWGTPQVTDVSQNPFLSLLTPTTGATFQTPDATLAVTGLCTDLQNRCDQVAWSNDRGGSGFASFDTFTNWSIAAVAGGDTTLISTSFANAANIDLKDYTVVPVGGAVTQRVNDSGVSNFIRLFSATGLAYARFDEVDKSLLYTMAPASAMAGTHYSWGLTLGDGASGATANGHLIFGYVNTTNYCGVTFYGTSATTGYYLWKKVAGVVTTLATSTSHLIIGHTLGIDVNASALAATDNGVAISGLSATDGACDDGTIVGLGFGALRLSTDDISTAERFSDALLVDHAGAGTGIALQSGVNVLTFTPRDLDGNLGDPYTLTVTRASDTQVPTLSITLPTTGPTYGTSVASQTVSGDAADNVGVDHLTYTLTGATTGSGAVTCAACGPAATSVSWAMPAVTLMVGATTVTVTAHDAAGNMASKTLVITLSTDVTAPSCSIAHPTASPYAAPSATLDMDGGCTDAVGVTSVTWTSTTCGGGTASSGTGTSVSWFITGIPLTGDCTITIHGHDQAGNDSNGPAQVVTYQAVLTISTVALPGGIQNQVYSQTLSATGGSGARTWDNNSGGSSLGGGACTGLSITTSAPNGLVSGTPTTTGTCAFTARVTDSSGSDTQPLSIVVSASGSSSNAYFNGLVADAKCYRAWSMRPNPALTTKPTLTVDVANCINPSYAYQLNGTAGAQSGYRAAGSNSDYLDSPRPAYDATNDATLYVDKPFIEAFMADNTLTIPSTLTTALTASAGDNTIAVTNLPVSVTVGPGRSYKIDNEIMLTLSVNYAAKTSVVQRASFGTALATHAIGAHVKHSYQGILSVDEINYPADMVEGYTYFATQDVKLDSAYGISSENVGYKYWQMRDNSASNAQIWLETVFCSKPSSSCAPGLSLPAGAIGSIDTRTYNIPGTQPDWNLTNGTEAYQVTKQQPITPKTNNIAVFGNRWIRLFWRLQLVANDYDIVDLWVCDEIQACDITTSHVVGPSKVSIRTPNIAPRRVVMWQWEENSSQDGLQRGGDFDLNSWGRNMVILRDAGLASAGAYSDANMPTYLVKPLPYP